MVPIKSSNFSAESLFPNFFCSTNCFFICTKKPPLHSNNLSFLPGKQMESEAERSRHVYIGDWLTNSWAEVHNWLKSFLFQQSYFHENSFL